MKSIRVLKIEAALITVFFAFEVFAAKGAVSTASFTVIGRVPEVYSLSTQSLKQDLDLKPGLKVTKKPIGNIRFSYNQGIQGISIASSTASGNPEDDSNKAVKFTSPFTISVLGGCRSLDMGTLKPGVTLVPAGADYKSLTASNLTDGQSAPTGVDEECQLAASWKTEKLSKTQMRSKKGVYSMNVIVTMVAL